MFLIKDTFKDLRKNFQINLKLTNFCNLGCSHCYLNKEEFNQKKLMDIDLIKIRIEKINFFYKEQNLKKILLHLTGGEPLVANFSYFEEISEIIKNNLNVDNFDILISTNLTLNITPEMIKVFQNFPNLQLQTSYDHLTKRFNEKNYLKWKNNIKLLVDNGIKIHCNITITKSEIGQEEEIFNELKDLGFFSIENSLYKPFFNQTEEKNNLATPFDNISNFHIKFYELFKKYNPNILIVPIDDFYYSLKYNEMETRGACDMLQNVNIDIQGNMYLCTGSWGDNSVFNEKTLNIKDVQLNEIYKNNYLKLQLSILKPNYPQCFTCEYSQFCFFSCPLYKIQKREDLYTNECPGLSKVWKYTKDNLLKIEKTKLK